jgi:hypothetical protein
MLISKGDQTLLQTQYCKITQIHLSVLLSHNIWMLDWRIDQIRNDYLKQTSIGLIGAWQIQLHFRVVFWEILPLTLSIYQA